MKQMMVVYRRRHVVSLAVIAGLGLAGCASTDMHSFVDPGFRGHSFTSLMVAVQLDKLDQRDDAETVFVEKLGHLNARCVRALDVLPPTREYGDEEFDKALADAGIDAVLIVRQTEYYEEEYYVPPSSYTRTSGNLSANTYYHGNRARTRGSINTTSHTTTTGGYTYTKPRVRHEIQLWSAKTKKMAWIGGTFTGGNKWADFDTLMSALARKVAKTLCKEGLLLEAVKE